MDIDYELVRPAQGANQSRIIAVEAGKLAAAGLSDRVSILGKAKLRPTDFGKDFFSTAFLKIVPLGEYSYPVLHDQIPPQGNEVVELLQRAFENRADFDLDNILHNPCIIQQLMMQQTLSGDIYVARFSPADTKLPEPYNEHYSIAFFADSRKGTLEVIVGNEASVKQAGQVLYLGDNGGDFSFCARRPNCWTSEGIVRVGHAILKRENLASFSSRGTFGSPHSNPPGIALAGESYIQELLEEQKEK